MFDSTLFVQTLSKLKTDHPIVTSVVVFLFVIPFINVAIRFMTSKNWTEFQKTHPRTAAFFLVLKALGIDPVAVLKWVFFVMTGHHWKDPNAKTPDSKPKR